MSWDTFELMGWCCPRCGSWNLEAYPAPDNHFVIVQCKDCEYSFVTE